MSDEPANSGRVFIPNSCAKCKYPTELGAYKPGEALLCPECGHEFHQQRLTREDLEELGRLHSFLLPFFFGLVIAQLASLGSLMIGILFRSSESYFIYPSGFIVLFTGVCVLLFARYARRIGDTRLGIMCVISWLMFVITQVCWLGFGLDSPVMDIQILLFFSATTGGAVLAVSIPRRMLRKYPIADEARNVKLVSMLALLCVPVAVVVLAMLRETVTGWTNKDWFANMFITTCVASSLLVCAPAYLLMSLLLRWDRIAGLPKLTESA
ncbi:MAG: hypothetical protein R3B67_01650 [Phycisphaerales bacterium]